VRPPDVGEWKALASANLDVAGADDAEEVARHLFEPRATFAPADSPVLHRHIRRICEASKGLK
jgi:hypothetical protein